MTGNPWVDDEDDDTWLNQEIPGPEQTDGEAAASPLPYLDPEVEAALAAEGPPEWLGTRWRTIEPGQQWDAWNGLRRWVDWFIREYRLTTSDVPACWYRHPDLTAELYAAMCMEYKVWEEGAPGLAPMMMWHPNVAQPGPVHGHAVELRLGVLPLPGFIVEPAAVFGHCHHHQLLA